MTLQDKFRSMSLHNKIFLSILAVILLISAAIALLARGILISSLTTELELRGVAVAHSVADKASSLMLDKDQPSLISLVFEAAQLGDRKSLVSYIYVTDMQQTVVAHTFTRPFPSELKGANLSEPGANHSVKLLEVHGEPAYDIAVPVKEGIYQIGTVHVGLNKRHIDQLVGKLRITFLGFISAIFVIIFWISHRLSRNITRPISRLTRLSDDMSRGNFDIPLDLGDGTDWQPEKCPAFNNTELPCWHFDQLARNPDAAAVSPEKIRTCRNCAFYRKRPGDEVVQLADSFNNMIWSIKLYRKQLRESEEKYRSLFDSGPDPIFVVDYQSHHILDANPRAVELYEYPKEELLGMKFTDLVPDYVLACQSRLDDTERPSSCVWCPKVIHYRKGLQPFYVNVHACPISYKGRQAVILAATDITEMVEKDAQLIQASKMKTLGEMSAGIAHELNQPLNAIRMGSDYLEMMVEAQGEVPTGQLVQVVREIGAQVERASDIINTLREFGRKEEFHKERLDVNRSVRAVLMIFGKQLALQNIHVALDLKEPIGHIFAQNNRLQQVLFNLLTNAKDAILQHKQDTPDSEGTISIRTFEDNGWVGISVSDTGTGIPPEVRDKIFEPFFTTKDTGQGMGLGLSITYGIVRDYGGSIDISSESGRGATFTLTFPAIHRH